MFSLTLLVLLAAAGDPLAGAPEITEDQEKLIKLMGDDSFKEREKATAALGKMDYAGLKAMHKAANHSDPEIAHRGRSLLGSYYSVLNSKKEVPGIQGLYEMKSFKLKTGKTMEIKDGDAGEYYKSAKGDASDMEESRDANNFKTRDATVLYIKQLRDKGFTKEEVQELLDKMTEEAGTSEMGSAGYKKFREMQGLPEYDPWGPGLGFGVFPGGMNPLPAIRNLIFRGGRPFMPPARD
jgi:hypothetical protein